MSIHYEAVTGLYEHRPSGITFQSIDELLNTLDNPEITGKIRNRYEMALYEFETKLVMESMAEEYKTWCEL